MRSLRSCSHTDFISHRVTEDTELCATFSPVLTQTLFSHRVTEDTELCAASVFSVTLCENKDDLCENKYNLCENKYILCENKNDLCENNKAIHVKDKHNTHL